MKTYGASIFCSTCHAEPFPDLGSGFRGTFDLLKVGDSWLCERCRPAKPKPALRPPAVTSLGALDVFEDLLAARLEEAVGDESISACRAALARGLDEVRKAIVAHQPPAAAKRKASPTVRRADQGELVEASPAAAATGQSEAAP